MARISGIVNTFNAEQWLQYALRSLTPWVDELVVVDMHSDDATVEIATQHGARVLTVDRANFVEPARAFAVEQATGDWVFILDSDEVAPPPLSKALRAIADADSADVARVPRLNYIAGDAMSHTGWGPRQDLQPRFFKPGALVFSDKIHALPQPAGDARVTTVGYAPGKAIVHFNYVDLTDFVERLNRYTTIEAEQLVAKSKRSSLGLGDAAGTFARRYVKGRGYKDGWRGLYLSLLMAFYRLLVHAKAKEQRAVGEPSAVEETYRRTAEDLLKGYS